MTKPLGQATDAMPLMIDLPPCEGSQWVIDRFIVPDIEPDIIRLAMNDRYIPPGTYTRLLRKPVSPVRNIPVMSNAPAEIQALAPFNEMVHGKVLINGLGLGLAVQVALAHPTVTSIDVVEISQDLIDLVAQFYHDSRLQYGVGDAYTFAWPNDAAWDVAWHDIWDEPDVDGATRLVQRYAGRAERQGWWQG